MSPRNPVATWRYRSQRSGLSLLVGGLPPLLVLGLMSVYIRMADFDPVDLVRAGSRGRSVRLFMVSRVPYTLAAALAGSGIAVAGAVMQMSVHNHFVSPTMAGTTQFAVIKLLLVALFVPGTSILVKMLVASAHAVTGLAVFLWLLRLLPHRRTSDNITVPLIGLMLSGAVGVDTTFVTWRYGLLQSLGSWAVGDLSRVLANCYELLWLVTLIILLLYLVADRLTVASLGAETATELGLSYHHTIDLTIMATAVITAINIAVVGSLPFFGLAVPSIVSRLIEDNLRQSFPIVAVGGTVLTLGCDAVGRVARYPYEVPLSVVVRIVSVGIFTVLILRGAERG